MTKSLLMTSFILLFAIQSQALHCEKAQSGPVLTTVGWVGMNNSFGLMDVAGKKVGRDFETEKSCKLAIAKMKSDRPFLCLETTSGFSGGIMRLAGYSRFAIFGPNGKQYGSDFGEGRKSVCNTLAMQGTTKAVCIPRETTLNYKVVENGIEITKQKSAFGGFELWGSGVQKRYSDYKDCLKAGEAHIAKIPANNSTTISQRIPSSDLNK